MKTSLQRAINSCSTLIVDGYLIDDDGYPDAPDGFIALDLPDETRQTYPEQEIEIDSDGCASVLDAAGIEHAMEFRVSRPMAEADLL